MNMRFPSLGSSLDHQLTKDGKPLAIEMYKTLVKKKYIISKRTNTSYVDAGKITPTEREYILQFIQEEDNENAEFLRKQQQELEEKTRKK